MKHEIAKVIVGQDDVIEQLLIAIFARSHCLLEGVPGLAKTFMVRSLARVLQLSFRRVQFTPDLMPADITGTDIIQENSTNRGASREALMVSQLPICSASRENMGESQESVLPSSIIQDGLISG